jgi:RNA polymerase sigma factor (sigma-70 family)
LSPNGQELLAEFVQYGRQKPFEEIVRRYAGMVFNVCFRITKDKHEAEDATQAVFLTLALQAKRGTEIKALGPWLQQVAKRLALDSRRSKKRRKTREERHHEEQTLRRESILADTLPSADMDELKTVLHEELQKLPAKYRMPLILHYFGGLTRDEMAAELNCKASTLGVRIFRGREMLAGRLSGRGIHISAGALAVALSYTVTKAISDALVASTSHAATALLAGHDGAGFASAHVIGLTRRASSALALGKVKLVGAALVLAVTSLGAGHALGMLPQINVTQLITNQVQRMVRPLFEPFTRPLRVDAGTPASKNTTASVPQPSQRFSAPLISLPTIPTVVSVTPPGTKIVPAGIPTVITPSSQLPAALPSELLDPTTTARSTDSDNIADSASDDHSSTTNSSRTGDVAEASIGGAGGGGAGGGSGPLPSASDDHHTDESVAKPPTATWAPSTVQSISGNNLYVRPALTTKTSSSKTSSSSATTASGTSISAQSLAQAGTNQTTSSSTGPTASAESEMSPPTQIGLIPAIGGTVTATAGMISGYGTINLTGCIDVDGKVVANGQGIDRTLNLSSFTAITKDISNSSAGGTNGWYAVDHGRLTLSLQRSVDGSSLVWGEDPNAPMLDLVNSVRLSGLSPTTSNLTELSLLSPDRNDVPDLLGINGAPVGIWQVDPAAGEIASADLCVRYNDTLVDELGASESQVSLWTLSTITDDWQQVNPSTFSLDTADHTVSGYAQDFNYFAVAVPPAPGQDVAYLIANPSGEIAGGQTVPEPIGIIWLATAGALLGRRRRNQNQT